MSFVRLSRPHFLVGGVVWFALGSVSTVVMSWRDYLVGQSMVTLGQLTAHFVNEYADVEPDRSVRNRTMFSGGSGVLVDGELSPSTALRAAWVATISTVALGVVLTGGGRTQAAILGVVALFISWSYSMPPVRLLGTGWGEVATTVVVVVLVPWIAVATQGGEVTTELTWAMATLFPIHLAMMLIFEIPDLASDEAAGKHVLAVRLGVRPTIRLVAVAYAAAGLLVLFAVTTGRLPPAGAGALLFLVPATTSMWMLPQQRYLASSASAILAVGVAALSLTLALAV